MRRDDELQRFKTEINLVHYAESQGYEIDRKESSPASIVMRGPNNDKIVVATDTDGHGIYFSVRDERDNGTIIDFVQRRKGLTLGQVRRDLRPWLTDGGHPHPSPSRKPEPISKDRRRVLAGWFQARPQPPDGLPYLLKRGLRPKVLNDPRFAPRIRIDDHGAAIFPHYDQQGLSGYEIKNNSFTGFARGGKKGLWYSTNLSHAPRLVITESAVDALSHAQITADTDAAYISIGGQPSQEQWELIGSALRKAQRRGTQIIIGTDADPGGDQLAARLSELVPGTTRRERPIAKDWNDQLRELSHRIPGAGPPTPGI